MQRFFAMMGVWSPHKARVAADFGAAASSYDQAARLQREVLDVLMQRLSGLEADPKAMVDLGCGTGLALPPLRSLYPGAAMLALDLAEGMVRHARSQLPASKNPAAQSPSAMGWLVGDAEALPLASNSLDLIFSSLAIQWCEDASALFDELARVLKRDGRLVVSTLLEGTLDELRTAWREVDPGQLHVNQFLTHEALTAEVTRVFPTATIDVLPLCLRYSGVLELLRELKGLGARYKDDPRRPGATAPGRLRRLADAYGRLGDADSLLPATYQVAIIQV